VRDYPDLTPEEIARGLRASLNQTAGQSETIRLEKADRALGGTGARSREWKAYLK
jgi:hypothetical protein